MTSNFSKNTTEISDGLRLNADLSAEDGDGIVATVRALFAGEHGTAEPVVIVQCRRTERVSHADPLRHTIIMQTTRHQHFGSEKKQTPSAENMMHD